MTRLGAERSIVIQNTGKTSTQNAGFFWQSPVETSVGAKSLIWSDPVNPCESVGLFLSLSLLLPFSRTGRAAAGAGLSDD